MKQAVLLIVFLVVAAMVFGNGTPQVERQTLVIANFEYSDLPQWSDVFDEVSFMTRSITASFPTARDSQLVQIEDISTVYSRNGARYIIQDIHKLVPYLKDQNRSDYRDIYESYNKGLAKGQQLVFYPLSVESLRSIQDLVNINQVFSLDGSRYGHFIHQGKLVFAPFNMQDRSVNPFDVDSELSWNNLVLIGKLLGIDMINTNELIEGACIGTVLFNLDIFSVPDSIDIDDLSYLKTDKRNVSDGIFMDFSNEDIQVDFAFSEFKKMTVKLAKSVIREGAVSDTRLGTMKPMKGQYFLESWDSVLGGSNPYFVEISVKAQEYGSLQMYFTEQGIWFPVSLLEDLGEIESTDQGNGVYKIIRWPSNDRTHAGG